MTENANTLFICEWYPWKGAAGYHQMTRQWADALANCSQLQVVTLADAPPTRLEAEVPTAFVGGLRRGAKRWHLLLAALTGRSMVESQCNRNRVIGMCQRQIDRLRPAAVVFNHLRTAWLMPSLDFHQATPIYLAHNCESAAYESAARLPSSLPVRALLRWEANKMRRLEQRVLNAARLTVTLSQEDALRMRSLAPSCETEVVWPAIAPESGTPAEASGPQADAVLLVGSFGWLPKRCNAEWLALRVWPRVRQQRPNARLLIVGNSASQLTRRLGGVPGVEIHSNVDRLEPFYRRASVAVVPEAQCSGVKLKSLEAACHGVPMVSTSFGCEGTGLQHERELLIANSEQRFAESILRLLRDPALGSRLAAAAHSHVVTNFSWQRFQAAVARVCGGDSATPLAAGQSN